MGETPAQCRRNDHNYGDHTEISELLSNAQMLSHCSDLLTRLLGVASMRSHLKDGGFDPLRYARLGDRVCIKMLTAHAQRGEALTAEHANVSQRRATLGGDWCCHCPHNKF
jgi:hypothetical protein